MELSDDHFFEKVCRVLGHIAVIDTGQHAQSVVHILRKPDVDGLLIEAHGNLVWNLNNGLLALAECIAVSLAVNFRCDAENSALTLHPWWRVRH